MQAIVVTFDRLATRLIGCYGNEWVETPNLDRLAAVSTVFDNHFADTIGQHIGHAWLTGRHSLRSVADPSAANLGQLLRSADVRTDLILSPHSTCAAWDSVGFDRVIHASGDDGLDVDPNCVPIARLVQAAIALLREPAPQRESSAKSESLSPTDSSSLSETSSVMNRLVWLHAPEPGLPPEGFATLYFEDFEEREMPLAEVPRDEWSRELAVAAGSVSLVDHWIGELLAQVRLLSQNQPTLVVISAARGRSWTEAFFAAAPSPRGDTPADSLRDQEVKSPLIVSVQGGDEKFTELAGLRCPHLVQTTDLFPTLLDWFGIVEPSIALEGRSLLQEAISVQSVRRAVCFGDEDRNLGIRTTDWNCLTRLSEMNQPIPVNVGFGDAAWPEQAQLFSKPEDIWDVTDLSSQQPEVCEALVRQLNGFRRGEPL